MRDPITLGPYCMPLVFGNSHIHENGLIGSFGRVPQWPPGEECFSRNTPSRRFALLLEAVAPCARR